MAYPVHLIFVEDRQMVEHSFFWNFYRLPEVGELAVFFDDDGKKFYKIGAVCPLIRREGMMCAETFIFLELMDSRVEKQAIVTILESLNPAKPNVR